MATFSGTAEDDRLDDFVFGANGPTNDRLLGLNGNDTLRSYNEGSDTLDGGKGDDSLEAESGGHRLLGGPDNDTLHMDESDYYRVVYDFAVRANVGRLERELGNDTAAGGSGDDVFLSGFGRDELDGGAGYDVLVLPTASPWSTGTARFDRQSVNVQYGNVTVDLQAGSAAGDGTTGQIRMETDRIDFDTKEPFVEVSFNGEFGPVGAFSHLVTGFEVVIGNRGFVTNFSGTDRTDIMEVFDRGGTLNDVRTTGRIDGRGGMDAASYGGISLAGIVADLATGIVEGIRQDYPDGSFGNDFRDRLIGIEALYGSRFDDTIRGDDGDNILAGRGGDDVIDGRGGTDTVAYSTGRLGLTGERSFMVGYLRDGTGAITVDLDAGTATDDFGRTDTLISIENVIGGRGDDNLAGSDAGNSLIGGDGNDTLTGEDGVDVLEGGEGDDSLDGGDDSDVLKGGRGNDTVLGGGGGDLIFGDDASRPAVEVGDDSLSGGTGRDTLEGFGGADTLDGGKQDDTLKGGGDGDTLIGGKGNDNLEGGEGDDEMTGGKGNDMLDGEAGKDAFLPGPENDVLRGGAGIDTLDASAATAELKINLETKDFDGGGFGRNSIRDIEVIFGGDFGDAISGGGADESLSGGGGRDTLEGGAGEDTLYGDKGNDTLRGGGEDDVLFGDEGDAAGNDRLEGGDGDDRLNGNAGKDALLGDAGEDTLDGGTGVNRLTGGPDADRFVFSPGRTTITDFDVEGGDVIDVGAYGMFPTEEFALGAAVNVKGSVHITSGEFNLILLGVQVGDLNRTDFDL